MEKDWDTVFEIQWKMNRKAKEHGGGAQVSVKK